MAVTERAEVVSTEMPADQRPRLAEGVELIGEYEGSGYREAHYLARRPDGQLIQLSHLLYLLADAADGRRSFEEIADVVTRASHRGVSADDVEYLVDKKLGGLGILAAPYAPDDAVLKIDPLLALKFRARVVPEWVVHRLARAFQPLFWSPVIIVAVVAFAALDYWLFFVHGVAQSLRDTLYDPLLFLLVFAMVVVSAAFHEFGHAAACSYGGAKPGVMGAGIYLAWPAFYTDVSDSYRLDRAGRLRTDLGGVYFNAIFSLASAGTYFLTGFEPLLLVIVVQQIEIVHQLIPIVRLDGYYIVADLTGVPDLFTRTSAILRSLVPWRAADKRVTELKPWVRIVVTAWVVVVIPLLVFQLLIIGLHLPRILATAWDSMREQWDTATSAFGNGEALTAIIGILQMIVLAIPITGIGLMLVILARRSGHALWGWSEDSGPRRGLVVSAAAGVAMLLAFVWWPNGDYEPIQRNEKGTLQELAHATVDIPTGRPAFTVGDAVEYRGEEPGAPDEPVVETVPSPEPAEPPSTPIETTIPPTTNGPLPSTTIPPTSTTTEPSVPEEGSGGIEGSPTETSPDEVPREPSLPPESVP